MTLEDFEKSIAEGKILRKENDPDGSLERRKKRRKHHHHRDHDYDDERSHRKQSRHSREANNEHSKEAVSGKVEGNESADHHHSLQEDEEWVEKNDNLRRSNTSVDSSRLPAQMELKRDSWMESPSSLKIDLIQRPLTKHNEPIALGSSRANFELKIHANELNKHHLQELADGKEMMIDSADRSTTHFSDYTFGDEGAHWRMTKLKAVYRLAEETQRPVDEVAMERFENLRAFDEAREEEIELERRETYGKGYMTKKKPSGDIFQERKLDTNIQSSDATPACKEQRSEQKNLEPEKIGSSHETHVPIDQTKLNRLKAQMMKAKLRNSSAAPALEEEYVKAAARFEGRQEAEVVVLGAMESRMLAGPKEGIKHIDSKRGRERGLVEENEDMSIEDMVREERRTRHQIGGDSQRFAERIVKDGKFNVIQSHLNYEYALIFIQNSLDYLDENAKKLAKRVQKSEINLKNAAVSDFQKITRILDNCPLCYREDESILPIAPVVSLATRVYLTLPTEPEISDGGACIVPVQHRGNLLECDDDEWEEIRVGLPLEHFGTVSNRFAEFHEVPYSNVPRSRPRRAFL